MSINREFWLKPFLKNQFPNWNCPKCENGILMPLENTFSVDESGDTTVISNVIFLIRIIIPTDFLYY